MIIAFLVSESSQMKRDDLNDQNITTPKLHKLAIIKQKLQ